LGTPTMSYLSPTTGRQANIAFKIPRSEADLTERRLALKRWSEGSFGLLGRGPDCGASFITGFAAHAGVFGDASPTFADNVVSFYEKMRDEDRYVTYAIVPPQIDRSKRAHEQVDPYLYAGVKEERDGGIVVSGAQQLATGAAIADWVYLSCITPLGPGDEAYAISVATPVGAKGVKILSRRSYALGGNQAGGAILSRQFDETDALIVFDDVFIPWEYVFVYRDLETLRRQWTETLGHVLGNHQAQVRLWTKLEFLTGLALRAAGGGGRGPDMSRKGVLGELAAFTAMIAGLVLAQEQHCHIDTSGVAWPGREECFSAMVLQAEVYPEVLRLIGEMYGDAFTALGIFPSGGNVSTEEDNVLHALWDATGSEFAGRHQQYEMFYAGAPFIVKSRMFDVYSSAVPERMVDQALARYDLGGWRR